MGRTGSHAVVIGASMGGLLAARALSGPYSAVTVVDRDELPVDTTNRRGVPQGRHVHLLLARGAQILEAMFPGLLDELEAGGAPVLRHWACATASFGGHRFNLPAGLVEPTPYQPSRPFLESRVRARLRAMPGVEILDNCEATGLLSTPGGERVTGLRIRRDGSDTELAADLVVDSTGRTGRAPVWLRDLGYSAAPEDQLPVDLVYVSRTLRMPADALGPLRLVVVGPRPGVPRGLGLYAVEGGRWILTLLGYGEDHPPSDDAGFDAFTAALVLPAVMAALRAAEPLGDVVTHRFPASLRRRYERLDRFPSGFLVFGDAVCSFNPFYGQGMSVAALEAQALRACLVRGDRGDTDLAARFFRAAAKVVDVAWQLAIAGDLSLPEIPGHRSPRVRVFNAYVEKVQAAAERDPVVAETFLRVAGFMDPPARLLAPDMAIRVLRGARSAGPTPTAPAPGETAPPAGTAGRNPDRVGAEQA